MTEAEVAKPICEILDDAPLVMRKPLAIIGDQAYAAIWPHVKVIVPASDQKDACTAKTSRQLCIVRSDGELFGGGKLPMSDLGFEVALKEVPPDDKLWSPRSAKGYARKELVDPCEVFKQVVEVVNRFIDFDRSLADQQTMSELVGCCIISPWFLDAFKVIGFLWPNGEPGSGKTQLLTLIAELGYLGQLILAGSSYASLRDLADYGATLCFDDAENVTDVKRTDPDKRTLLLAGNRRGNSATVKEPDGERGWRTRHVNTFCMRAFSATQLPDRVLGSRSIVVPLIRTANSYRANADPLEYGLWPHDRRMLLDSLWSIALASLTELGAYEAKVNRTASISGRNLEPWRAGLAVAAWLQDRGVSGIYDRLSQLSVHYQTERQNVSTDDVVVIVIRALCECLNCDVVTLRDLCDVAAHSTLDAKTLVLTADIAAAACGIVVAEELDIDAAKLESRRIGNLMRKLRFTHGDQGGTHKKGWLVGKRELANLAISYGIVNRDPCSVSDSHDPNVTNVTDGHNVTHPAKNQREENARLAFQVCIEIDEESTETPNAPAITSRMRQRLRDCGESDEEIDNMTPPEAAALIQYFDGYEGSVS